MNSEGSTPNARDELIAALSIDSATGESFWRAFGFTEDAAAYEHFSDAEMHALRAFAERNETAERRAQLTAAREIGQAMSRLAEWEAGAIAALIDDRGSSVTEDQVLDAVAEVHSIVWRRHLRSRLHGKESGEESRLIVGFADIVGYTSMSRRMRISELGELLETFESSAHSLITNFDGRIVKTIGDAVMFACTSAPAAAEIAIALHQLTADEILPPLRIGLAAGDVLTRTGDVFGEPVNIAARLTSSAHSGTTLADDRLAEQLRGDDRFYLRSISPLSVRGYRRLRAYQVLRDRRWSPE